MSDRMELSVESSTLTQYKNFGTPQYSIDMEAKYIASNRTFVLTRGEDELILEEENVKFLLAAIPYLRSFFGHNDEQPTRSQEAKSRD